MTEAYTVKIFMIDGNPQGLRTIENDRWKGKALVFPREGYEEAKNKRDEFNGQGIYILQGYEEDEAGQEIPLVYIGKTADKFISRINNHYKNKFEWDEGILLSASAEILHQGKVSWLEHKFIELAKSTGRSKITNEQGVRKPDLSESDENEAQRFFDDSLKILPLGGFNIFNQEKAIQPQIKSNSKTTTYPNTIIVPASMAREEAFNKAMFEKNAWWAIRVSKDKMPHLTHIAFYQSKPVSGIQYLAEIEKFEPYGDAGKYKVVFKGEVQKLDQFIPLGDNPTLALQAPRYAFYDDLMKANKLSDVFK